MDILAQLGIDKTVFHQLGLFLVSYFFLSKFLFQPYLRNLEYRRKNTGGSIEEAGELEAQAAVAAEKFRNELSAQNQELQAAYQKIKGEGQATQEKLLTDAREKASNLLKKNRQQIETEMAEAQKSLKKDIPEISSLVAGRVLGRDL